MFEQEKIRTLASGLRFPEGSSADRDGSVLVPEIEGAAVVRVHPDGRRDTVADVGGGANGCAFGPDGSLYVCNDGGFLFTEVDGVRIPVGAPPENVGGSVQRVDPLSGAVETVFTESGGERLGGLNDIVFDTGGHCYVVDTTGGKIHYADPVAGTIRVAASGLIMPNGAGLTPDGARLHVSETMTGRIRTWAVAGPGELVEQPDLHQHGGAELPRWDGWDRLAVDDAVRPYLEGVFWDGLAVDGAGNVCVADLPNSGICVIDPQGQVVGRFVTPVRDPYVTNLCFGGAAGNTAYVSSAGRGLLYEVPWPWPGLRLNFQP